MKQRFRAIKNIPWVGMVAALSVLITGSWAADVLKGDMLFSNWFPLLKEHQILVMIGTLLLFLASFLFLYKHKADFLGVQELSHQLCDPHEGLILLLTDPNFSPPDNNHPWYITKGGITVCVKGDSLDEDINELEKLKSTSPYNYWNWQQILRGLQPHQSSLKQVYLIGSDKSSGYYEHAKRFVESYFKGRGISVKKLEEPINFEDFPKLVRAIKKAVDVFKESGIKEKDIIIDVTGGQKTASIAAAAVTLNSEVTFQYVQTAGRNGKYDVLAYDVTVRSSISAD